MTQDDFYQRNKPGRSIYGLGQFDAEIGRVDAAIWTYAEDDYETYLSGLRHGVRNRPATAKLQLQANQLTIYS